MQAATDRASRAALWARFSSKAEILGAVVERAATESEAAELVAREQEAPAGTRGLAERFPDVAARCEPIPGQNDAAAEVVAVGVLAVAESGSVLVCESAPDRGACFLAEHLWLLVPANQVVPTLDAALERLAGLVRNGTSHATFMSGPSRTADIERILTIGVHGPSRLTVVAVGDEHGEGSG